MLEGTKRGSRVLAASLFLLAVSAAANAQTAATAPSVTSPKNDRFADEWRRLHQSSKALAHNPADFQLWTRARHDLHHLQAVHDIAERRRLDHKEAVHPRNAQACVRPAFVQLNFPHVRPCNFPRLKSPRSNPI